MLWSMAANLKKMVTKRLKGSNEITISQDRVSDADLSTTQGASARKFDSFQDQLKQIRLSKEYLEKNPEIKQQIIMHEQSGVNPLANDSYKGQQVDMFAIADDDDDDEYGEYGQENPVEDNKAH